MSKLAINGGPKVRTKLFPKQETVGHEELEAVKRVFAGERLSYYRGNDGENFMGGPEIQAFEKEFSEKFNIKHSLAVNSCTSALQIACMAVLKPGDECIVTPWSMSCSASAPLVAGAVPVFADIEPEYFCLSYESVKAKITPKTKAIIAVDLFGQPFDYRIRELADEHGIIVIEDAAQAIGSYVKITDWTWGVSSIKTKYAGSIGHIGCFSFTQGKHLTAGEGGMITTNDDELADRMAMIRNHAESVNNDRQDKGKPVDASLNGYNLRMTEVQAAIMREQLKKLDRFIELRNSNVLILNEHLEKFNDLFTPAPIRDNCSHSYYVSAYIFNDHNKYGVHRDTFIDAVKAELTGEEIRIDKGVPIGCGYIKPLYRFPIFGEYDPLPVVEYLWTSKLFLTTLQQNNLDIGDIKDIYYAFKKVYENMEELK